MAEILATFEVIVLFFFFDYLLVAYLIKKIRRRER